MKNRNFYKDVLVGLAVGDALGVPVEFTQRSALRLDPVTHMRGFGSHDQPAGTWSDDSSLAFCLADTLAEGFDLQALANYFVAWLSDNHWTPRGKVFILASLPEKRSCVWQKASNQTWLEGLKYQTMEMVL